MWALKKWCVTKVAHCTCFPFLTRDLRNISSFLLQALVAEREGYAVDDQVVLMGGKPLEDEGVLVNLCQDMTTLDVDIRMLGGEFISPDNSGADM